MKTTLKTALTQFFLISIILNAYSASVDTVTVFSAGMNKKLKCIVVKPDRYNNRKLYFPVVYLLHGYTDRYDTWIRKVPAIKSYSDKMQIILVCPDGGYSSWYFDSPIDSTFKYETYISKEVVSFIDSHFRTIPDRTHRSITGLSMGGHGSLYLAIKHPEVFGAAGSMSGGVDLRPFPNNWDIAKRIGDSLHYSYNWKNMSIINLIDHFPSQPIFMMIECGTEDFFCQANEELHKKMLQLKIPHDFIERPGSHNWKYWENSIEYQLQFFNKHFEQEAD